MFKLRFKYFVKFKMIFYQKNGFIIWFDVMNMSLLSFFIYNFVSWGFRFDIFYIVA